MAAIGGIIVVVLLLSWLNERSLEGGSSSSSEVASTETPAQGTPPPAAQTVQTQPTTASGPVILTATQEAWIQVKDGGKTLFEGVLQPGQTYQLPPNVTAPVLKAGKPEALRITVGSAIAPPVGSPGKVASNVSLDPAALMRGGADPAPDSSTTPAPSAPPGVRNRTG